MTDQQARQEMLSLLAQVSEAVAEGRTVGIAIAEVHPDGRIGSCARVQSGFGTLMVAAVQVLAHRDMAEFLARNSETDVWSPTPKES